MSTTNLASLHKRGLGWEVEGRQGTRGAGTSKNPASKRTTRAQPRPGLHCEAAAGCRAGGTELEVTD